MLNPFGVNAWEVVMKRKRILLVVAVILLTSLSCDLPVSIARLFESRAGFAEKPYTIVPDPTDIPSGFENGVGSVVLNDTYEPVQVSIEHDMFIPTCNIHYQSNAESGVLFSFVYNLDAGTFTGSVYGSTHASEYEIWETWSNFGIEGIEGTITRAENGQDYEFSGKGYLEITLKQQAKCDFQLGDPTVTEKVEPNSREVNVSGKIWHDGIHWRWSPLIESSDKNDMLSFFLRCINCDVTPDVP